ncbi:MAG: type II secretion system F family protein [Candidatus Levybacteria bacterium]|nr:type II secretion system F family protein [Candidatus Levybacteria bacterium]
MSTKLERIHLSANEKYSLISNLSTMFSAGIPILESIESLLEGAKGNQKKLLETIRDDLTQGNHLYTSFGKFPRIFDIVTVNIIKASEEAGTLDVALKDLRGNIRKDSEFSDKLKSAFIYPIFIMCVFFGVLLMILTVVVPRISQVFSRLRVELPLPTKIIIAMSDILIKHTLLLALAVLFFIGLIFYLFRNYRRVFVNVLFSFPYLSKLAREIDLTKFTHSLFLLLNAGIPITSALELTVRVVMKKEVSDAIQHAKDAVSSGRKFSEGLRSSGNVIPSIMIKITEAGEKSGSLDKSMQDISEYLDYEVSTSLKTLVALLEPLMLVLVGVLVGGIMLAIIAPIYSLIGQVSPK